MKIFLVITILVCFVMLGHGISKYYIERKKFFSELELFMSNLSSHINFGRDKILEIVSKYNKQNKCNSMNKLCANYATILKEKLSVNQNLVEGITILKKEEAQMLQNFFSTLGKFDIYTQTKEINSYSVKFKEYYKNSSEECNKYAYLVLKLALIVGLLVCLLII